MSKNNDWQVNNYIYKPIGNYLIEANLITEACLFQALEEQKNTQERIGDILVRQGNIKRQTLDYLIEKVIVKERQNLTEPEKVIKNYHLTLPIVNLYPAKIIKILFVAIASLFFLSIVEKTAVVWFNSLTSGEFNARFFGFDEEANFPTLYSTLTLAFSSFLLAVITVIKKFLNSRYAKFWRALSLIFLFMAIDEICSLHEILIPLIKIVFETRGLLFFPWVIPAFILLIVFLIAFRKFIFNLPTKIRNIFLLAGSIYIGGALGMELIGGYLADTSGLDTTAYWIAALIEELLEMFGILIFIYGLLSYIQSYIKQLDLPVSFQKEKTINN
ncbi:MAG: hypothetical protein Tsb0014_09520 [Pleurocapsa sp.]